MKACVTFLISNGVADALNKYNYVLDCWDEQSAKEIARGRLAVQTPLRRLVTVSLLG